MPFRSGKVRPLRNSVTSLLPERKKLVNQPSLSHTRIIVIPTAPNFGRTFASDSLHWWRCKGTVRGHRMVGGFPWQKAHIRRKPIKAALIGCEIDVMNLALTNTGTPFRRRERSRRARACRL